MSAKPRRKWLSLLAVIPILLLFGSDFVAQIRHASAEKFWNDRVKNVILPGMSETDAEAALRKLDLSPLWAEDLHQISSFAGTAFHGFMGDYGLRIEVHLDDENRVKSAEVKHSNSAWI